MSRLESLRLKAKLLQKNKKKVGKEIRLKEAYDIVARSAGYSSWREMKEVVERYRVFSPQNCSLPYWNNWYSTYEDGISCFNPKLQYILPYEKGCFICEEDYIRALGLSLNDPDLLDLGRDWVHPNNLGALERVKRKIEKANETK